MMIDEKVVKTVLESCMALKKNEKCLIVTDTNKIDIAEPFFTLASKMSKDAKISIMTPLKNNGDEPTEEVAQLMKEYDVELLITSKSLSHTAARRNANEKGARIASMPGINEDMLNRCVELNYTELGETNDKLRSKISSSKGIHITSPGGTDIKTTVTETHGTNPGQFHNKGDFGNLPSGEVDSGVILEKTNGTLVIDCSMAGVGKIEDKLTIKIEKGIATEITGEKSDELKEILDEVGPDAYIIAELGIGTNPKAIITGNILEDEKVKGTIHMALGNDMSYGGDNDIPLHLDGICDKPTIIIDDEETIMKDGELLL